MLATSAVSMTGLQTRQRAPQLSLHSSFCIGPDLGHCSDMRRRRPPLALAPSSGQHMADYADSSLNSGLHLSMLWHEAISEFASPTRFGICSPPFHRPSRVQKRSSSRPSIVFRKNNLPISTKSNEIHRPKSTKMSLRSILNHDGDSDSRQSSSCRSTPDPATPSSISSITEAWTLPSPFPSLHKRNESFESTTSTATAAPDLSIAKFPPFNNLPADAIQQARHFNVKPLGAVGARDTPIPYSSNKRELRARTGIEKLYVCYYTFRLPGEHKEWEVLWDYREGLVRFTPFFRCLGYSKTAPAKAVEANPGLPELKHNITGGSIGAQGYWIPYHCARELATKFCHPIAGALIPIFGPDFPRQCIPPGHPDFENMTINPSTIKAAERDALDCLLRHQQRERSATNSPAIASQPYSMPGLPRAEGSWSEPPSNNIRTTRSKLGRKSQRSSDTNPYRSSPSQHEAPPRSNNVEWSHTSNARVAYLSPEESVIQYADSSDTLAPMFNTRPPYPTLVSSRPSTAGDDGTGRATLPRLHGEDNNEPSCLREHLVDDEGQTSTDDSDEGDLAGLDDAVISKTVSDKNEMEVAHILLSLRYGTL